MRRFFVGLLLLPMMLSAMDPTGPMVYYRDLEKTASENDEYQAMFAQESVFIQLVVQASKSKRDNKKPFQELLQRIGKEVKIEEGHTYVGMTLKDGNHRLLSYIPRIEEPMLNAIVNGKKIDLMFTEMAYIDRKGKIKAEDTFMVDYDFTSDENHHAKIVAEYNELLLKNSTR